MNVLNDLKEVIAVKSKHQFQFNTKSFLEPHNVKGTTHCLFNFVVIPPPA